MGNARARGTYEQRKEQAIAAGRIKTGVVTPKAGPMTLGSVLAMLMMRRHYTRTERQIRRDQKRAGRARLTDRPVAVGLAVEANAGQEQ